MSATHLQKLSIGSGSQRANVKKRVFLRELGPTEENWSNATALGSGIVIFGMALKRIVDTRLISLAAQEVRNHHPLASAMVVVDIDGRMAYQIAVNEEPTVDVRPWPEVGVSTDLSGVLLLAGDSQTEGYALSKALNWIVQDELNIAFTTRKDLSPIDKSATNVLEFHVYYHGSKPLTIIAVRMFGGALDRPSGVNVIKTFIAGLNAAVVGEEKQCSTTIEGQLAGGGKLIWPPLEQLMHVQFLRTSILKGVSMVGKAWICSILPFQEGFPNKTDQSFRTRVLSYTLGKQGTESLFAAAEKAGAPYFAVVAAAFLKASTILYTENGKKKANPEFGFTVLLDCRRLLPKPLPESAIGVYSAGISIEKKMKTNEELWDLARRISSTYKEDYAKEKHFSHLTTMHGIFSQVMKRPSMTPSLSLRTSAFALFSEPLATEWENTENLDLVGTYGPFSSFHGPGPCFFVGDNLVQGPELYLSLTYVEPIHSRNQMEAIASVAIDQLCNGLPSP